MGIRSEISNYIRLRSMAFAEKRFGLKNPPYWFLQLMGNQSQSGVAVTNKNAENLAAYYACRLLISNTIAQIPLGVRREDANGIKTVDKKHPVHFLLSQKPNDFHTSFIWRSIHTQLVLDYGNSYSFIIRNPMGVPYQIGKPLNPADVTPFFFTNPDTGTENLFYSVKGFKNAFYPADILHFRNPIVTGASGNDILTGKSVLTAARESLGLGLAQQQYGSETYKNGGAKRIALTHPKTLNPTTKDNLRKSWRERYSGPDKMSEIAILEAGVDVKEIGMNPIDADFLNSRQWTALEICQFFGMFQPSKIGHPVNDGYNSLEQQSIAFVTDTLLPRLVMMEQEFNDKLFSTRLDLGCYTKFNTNGLLRGDTAARKEYYRTLFNIGVLNRNQIAALEDMNPIPDGDKHYLQQNLAPAEDIGELIKLKYENKKTTNPPGDEGGNNKK